MKKIKVYRFELNGKGPYSYYSADFRDDPKLECAIINIWETVWISQNNSHPDIFWDIKADIESDRIKRKIYTGCLSKEDIFEWFKFDIKHLKTLGFALLEYTVNEKDVYYTESGRQVGFKRKSYPFRVIDY